MPAELARRDSRLKKIQEAKAALEEEARERAEKEAKEARRKIEQRRLKEQQTGRVQQRARQGVAALGLLCTGVAYLLYFRLVAAFGAAPALTVGFLIPLFGVLWGCLFLGETVGWHTLAGATVVVLGTALVTGFTPRMLWPAKAVSHE